MTTPPTMTLPVATLRQLLAPVVPMAAADDGLPVINSVLIEARDGAVYAWATDRFKVGMSRLPVDESITIDGDFRAVVPLDDVKHLLGLFKPRRGSDEALVRLSIEGSTLTAHKAGGMFAFSEITVGYRLLDGPYPNVRKLLVERLQLAHDAEPVNGLALNPAFLSKFQAAGPAITVDMPSNVRGTVLIRVGDSFVGVLMPRRDEPKSVGEWLTDLTTSKENAA